MTTIGTHETAHSTGQVQALDQPARRALIRQLGIDSAYVLVGFPLGVVSFVLMIVGLSLSAGLLVIVLGLAVLVATTFVARGLAEVERVRMVTSIRLPRVRVRYKKPVEPAGRWRKLLTPLTDIQSWLDVLYGIVRFPIAIATFVVTVVWWSITVAGITYPIYDRFLPRSSDDYELHELLGFDDTGRVRSFFYLVLGALFAITLPFVVRGCALVQAWLARSLLTGVATLRDQVADLAEDRATARSQTKAAVTAEATALRRLERDIHGGPQQRLVRLAVDLGRAKQQLDADPEAARATVDEALAQTREALDELRTLSRGIAPPILTDRGLVAAVGALAARATVPVELDAPDLGRLDPLAEQTAYFAIAEALTNVAKHSAASRCTVALRASTDRLTVFVSDDGTGGAHLSKGHGLAGLADRLHAVGGQLWVTSPAGGPTTITAELPCQSSD